MNGKKGYCPAFKGKKGEIKKMASGISKSIVADGHAMTDGDRYNKHMDKKGKIKGA